MTQNLSPISAEDLAEIQRGYVQKLSQILTSDQNAQSVASQDRRFTTPDWQQSSPYSTLAALYVLNSETLMAMTKAVHADAKTQQKLKFVVQQWIDALSPTNFLATNPEAQRRLIETKGESLRAGIDNLLHDMQKGRISQTDESGFVIGENLATTPGAVVFQNELLQLIQYKPSTPKVGSVPLLMVPPSINKFYIMDLGPQSSLVKFAVDQGHQVFLVSWKNPGHAQANATWEDYIGKGILKAIEAVKAISGSPILNALGFCVGGTMTTNALAVLAAQGDTSVQTLTLMTTLLDFSDTGVLDVFIDESQVAMREATIGQGGLLPGQELATTFSFLRPNDLVWNYVERNYLKGETPPAFDILYWNSDSTNLPGPFFAWYLRNTYLENNLVKPNKLKICGQSIDLRKIKMPVYAFGAREDHIVPWTSAWTSAKALTGANVRFVLGASGHIAGSINPAAKNKRSFSIAKTVGKSPEDFLSQAKEYPGSWWNDWAAWLKPYKGKDMVAPKKLGKPGAYKVLEPAPGHYVKEKAADLIAENQT